MKYILLLSLFFISPFSLAEETATEQTDAQALYEQGIGHLRWIVFPSDFRKAIGLIEKSARLGYAEAQIHLGSLYGSGTIATYFRGVEKWNTKESRLNDPGRAEDVRRALHWFEKAGNQGDAEIQYEVGRRMYLIYDESENVEDKDRALHWLEKAAQQGDAEMQYRVGRIMYKKVYGESENVEDKDRALHWLEKAAQQGDAEMQYRVGKIIHEDLYSWSGNVEDIDRALHWLQQSADQGHKEAIDLLSEINFLNEPL